VEYAAAVGYLERWSSSSGAASWRQFLWRCVTEGCSPAASDKAREGTYGVRMASHACRRSKEKLEEFSKYLYAALYVVYFGLWKPLKRYLVECALAGAGRG
jgi:hypothetical protein